MYIRLFLVAGTDTPALRRTHKRVAIPTADEEDVRCSVALVDHDRVEADGSPAGGIPVEDNLAGRNRVLSAAEAGQAAREKHFDFGQRPTHVHGFRVVDNCVVGEDVVK